MDKLLTPVASTQPMTMILHPPRLTFRFKRRSGSGVKAEVTLPFPTLVA